MSGTVCGKNKIKLLSMRNNKKWHGRQWKKLASLTIIYHVLVYRTNLHIVDVHTNIQNDDADDVEASMYDR